MSPSPLVRLPSQPDLVDALVAAIGRTPVGEEVAERVYRLELPFNELGLDPYGISRRHLIAGLGILSLMYRHYFTVTTTGMSYVPPRGRGMLVGNHSGGIAIDGMMVLAACFLELDPPRLAQGMAEKFLNRFPMSSVWTARMGSLPGTPEAAARLLEDDRLLMVFPEGARGTAKLFAQRNSLVDFGTGFVRLAMRTKTPIIPFGFAGGGHAVPTIANLYGLGKLLGVPYIPVTPWLLALPRPTQLHVSFGEPLFFEGTGKEDDDVIEQHVETVKTRIAALIGDAGARRRGKAP